MPKIAPAGTQKPRHRKEEVFNINFIKSELKLKKIRIAPSPQRLLNLQKIKMIQEVNKEIQKPNLSPEDEVKIEILKKKIAINNIMGSLRSERPPLEERKNIYKNLLLEYHPDKGNYEKEIAEDLFNYLQMSKHMFIED